jgi:VanZ family protein
VLAVRHPRSWLVIGWMLIAFAVLVNLVPGNELPNTGMNDKFEHTIAYGLLTLWFAGIYPRSRYVVIAVALFIMGVGIEFAQGVMHLGRQADVRDVVANTSGIAIGLTLALIGLGGWAEWIDGWTRSREPTRPD